MIADKNKNTKESIQREPNTRFYVRESQMTKEEMAEIEDYIQKHKGRNKPENPLSKKKIREINEKYIR